MSDRKAAPKRQRPRMWTCAVLASIGILLAAVSAQAANLGGGPRSIDLDLSSASASAAAPAQTGQIVPADAQTLVRSAEGEAVGGSLVIDDSLSGCLGALAIPRRVTVILDSPSLRRAGVAGAISSAGSLTLNAAGGGNRRCVAA